MSKCIYIVLSMLFGGFSFQSRAMPSLSELKDATPSVKTIMSKYSSLDDMGQAESALKEADSAMTEAQRYLLVRGAFFKYVRKGDTDKAIDALKTLPRYVEVELPHILAVLDQGLEKSNLDGLKVYRRNLVNCERKVLEPQYQKCKNWYKEQLSFNGLSEICFERYGDGSCGGFSYMVSLHDEDNRDPERSSVVEVKFENGQYLSYPKSMVRGYAMELIAARIIIYRYDNLGKALKATVQQQEYKQDMEFKKLMDEASAARKNRLAKPARRRGGAYENSSSDNRLKVPKKSELRSFKR